MHAVSYISRSLFPTEERYAQIEKEAQAFTWAFQTLVGLHVKCSIEADQKPLIHLLSMKHLEELPVVVQRFRLWMRRFNFNIVHVQGKLVVIAE